MMDPEHDSDRHEIVPSRRGELVRRSDALVARTLRDLARPAEPTEELPENNSPLAQLAKVKLLEAKLAPLPRIYHPLTLALWGLKNYRPKELGLNKRAVQDLYLGLSDPEMREVVKALEEGEAFDPEYPFTPEKLEALKEQPPEVLAGELARLILLSDAKRKKQQRLKLFKELGEAAAKAHDLEIKPEHYARVGMNYLRVREGKIDAPLWHNYIKELLRSGAAKKIEQKPPAELEPASSSPTSPEIFSTKEEPLPASKKPSTISKVSAPTEKLPENNSPLAQLAKVKLIEARAALVPMTYYPLTLVMWGMGEYPLEEIGIDEDVKSEAYRAMSDLGDRELVRRLEDEDAFSPENLGAWRDRPPEELVAELALLLREMGSEPEPFPL